MGFLEEDVAIGHGPIRRRVALQAPFLQHHCSFSYPHASFLLLFSQNKMVFKARNPKYKPKAKNPLSLPMKVVLMGVQGAEPYSLPPPFFGKFRLYFVGMTKMEDPKIQLLKMIFSFNIVPRGVAVKGLLAHWELKSSKDGMMHTIYLRYSL